MVGEVGVPTTSNFSELVCPTALTRAFAHKGQFQKLSNLAPTILIGIPRKRKTRRRFDRLSGSQCSLCL
jgi:hypothetical protein